jgi:hypothetical protein
MNGEGAGPSRPKASDPPENATTAHGVGIQQTAEAEEPGQNMQD